MEHAGAALESPRPIGAAAATTLVVASMIGTGVFTTSGLLVRDLGSPAAVLAAWALGGALAFCGALSYGELAAALPRNGGEYQLLGRIYHPAVGFTAGLVSLVVGFSAPLAASALAFGHYLSAVVPGVRAAAAAVGVVVVLAALHAFDVRLGSRVQAAVTALEVALVLAFVAAGAARGDPARILERPPLAAPGAPAFAVALVYVSFAYSGWNGAVYLAGEVRDPARSVPRALLLGTAIVVGLYLALNLVFLAAAPPAEIAGVVEVGHVAAVRLLGPGVGRVLSALVALVLASSVGAMLMAGPRVYEAMGRDHPSLAVLARRTRRGAPAVAVALQAAMAVAMIATSSFGTLLAYVGFTLSLSAGLTVLGVVVLRRREPALPRPYRAWGYPATPVLFVALSAWMVAHAVVERPASSWAGLGTVVAAVALRALLARAGRPRPVEEMPHLSAGAPRARGGADAHLDPRRSAREPGHGGERRDAMTAWKRICCAVDFSAASRFAMEEAAALTWRCGGEMTLVHVEERIPRPVATDTLVAPEVLDHTGAEIERALGEWRDAAGRLASRPVAYALLAGEPADEIVRFAGEGRYDLVVVGTHGRGELAHAMVGSVAERVVRQATCPVLVVRPVASRAADRAQAR